MVAGSDGKAATAEILHFFVTDWQELLISLNQDDNEKMTLFSFGLALPTASGLCYRSYTELYYVLENMKCKT